MNLTISKKLNSLYEREVAQFKTLKAIDSTIIHLIGQCEMIEKLSFTPEHPLIKACQEALNRAKIAYTNTLLEIEKERGK